MEYVFPTYQQLVHILPTDARITPPPDEMMDVSPTTANFSPSTSPDTRSETTTSSDGPAHPNPISFKPQPRRHSSFPYASSPGGTRRPSTAPGDVSARPIESLYTEHHYLRDSLQKQASRATGLVRQYVEADARHQTLEAGKERRKLRKHLGLLKAKINEAVDQEKVIFNRLGELYVEMQTHEAVAMAGFQARCPAEGSLPPTPSSYYTVASPFSPVATPLNASSPEFVPMGSFQSARRPSTSCSDAVPFEGVLETVEEEAELSPCSLTQYHYPKEYSDDVMEIDQDEDEWVNARLKATRVRRLSLPCFQAPWP